MSEEYFGDIVLYWGRGFEARVLSWFTNSRISHCAVRTSESRAVSIDILEGVMKHDLESPRDIYFAYAILRNRSMTSEKRGKMKQIFDSIEPTLEYDFARIVRLAGRHIKSRADNFFNFRNIYDFKQTEEDITTISESWQDFVFNRRALPVLRKIRGFDTYKGKRNGRGNISHDCASLPEMLKVYSGLSPSVKGVHYSQMEPQQLLQDPNCEVINFWLRDGYWIENGEERQLVSSSPNLNLVSI